MGLKNNPVIYIRNCSLSHFRRVTKCEKQNIYNSCLKRYVYIYLYILIYTIYSHNIFKNLKH